MVEDCVEKKEDPPMGRPIKLPVFNYIQIPKFNFTDYLEISFIVFVVLIVVLTLLSTIYDFALKRQPAYRNDPDYYSKPLKTRKISIRLS